MTSSHGGEISGQKSWCLTTHYPPSCKRIGEARRVSRGTQGPASGPDRSPFWLGLRVLILYPTSRRGRYRPHLCFELVTEWAKLPYSNPAGRVKNLGETLELAMRMCSRDENTHSRPHKQYSRARDTSATSRHSAMRCQGRAVSSDSSSRRELASQSHCGVG